MYLFYLKYPPEGITDHHRKSYKKRYKKSCDSKLKLLIFIMTVHFHNTLIFLRITNNCIVVSISDANDWCSDLKIVRNSGGTLGTLLALGYIFIILADLMTTIKYYAKTCGDKEINVKWIEFTCLIIGLTMIIASIGVIYTDYFDNIEGASDAIGFGKYVKCFLFIQKN